MMQHHNQCHIGQVTLDCNRVPVHERDVDPLDRPEGFFRKQFGNVSAFDDGIQMFLMTVSWDTTPTQQHTKKHSRTVV